MKKDVSLNTIAEIIVTVDVPQDVQDQFAGDDDGLREWVIEQAIDNSPSLCAHCVGFGKQYSISLGEPEFGLGFKVDHKYDSSNDVRDARD